MCSLLFWQTNNNEEQDVNERELMVEGEGEEEEGEVGGGVEKKLGRLFFTIKYSFEKNALIVTVNKCTNLPAKDAQNKSRYSFFPPYFYFYFV
jgi:hypothetical protein